MLCIRFVARLRSGPRSTLHKAETLQRQEHCQRIPNCSQPTWKVSSVKRSASDERCVSMFQNVQNRKTRKVCFIAFSPCLTCFFLFFSCFWIGSFGRVLRTHKVFNAVLICAVVPSYKCSVDVGGFQKWMNSVIKAIGFPAQNYY